MVGLLLALALPGCATRVVPPPHPQNPLAVYIADYGRHSSILLPTTEGQLIEYAYGDWEYFALNKYRWYIGASALFYSEGSGLGRRVLPNPNDEESLRRLIDSKRIIRIETDRRKVLELLNELDERFNSRIDTLVHPADQPLYFVKDDSHYGMFHTCNQATADWLTKLGCEVQGWPVVLSNFEVSNPAADAPPDARTVEAHAAPQPPEPVQLSQ
jgi:hypothetical protein